MFLPLRAGTTNGIVSLPRRFVPVVRSNAQLFTVMDPQDPLGKRASVPRLSIPMVTYSAGIFAHRFGASIQRTPDITSSLTPYGDPMPSNKGLYIGPVSQLAADAV